MKYLFKVLIIQIVFVLFFYACSSHKDSYIGDLESNISYQNFHQQSIQLLLSEPINLKIDTTYQNVIIASDIYEGKFHRKWFFWKARWAEKSIYTLRYMENHEGVNYTIEIKTMEAPKESFNRWRRVSPSRPTKENLIIQKLSYYE